MDPHPLQVLARAHPLQRGQIHGDPQNTGLDFCHLAPAKKIIKPMDGTAQGTTPVDEGAADGLMPVNGQPNQRGSSVFHWHSGTSVSSCCGRPIIVSRLPAMPSLTVPVARSGLAIVSP